MTEYKSCQETEQHYPSQGLNKEYQSGVIICVTTSTQLKDWEQENHIFLNVKKTIGSNLYYDYKYGKNVVRLNCLFSMAMIF